MAWTDLDDWSGLVTEPRMNAMRDSWNNLRLVGRGYAAMAYGNDIITLNNNPKQVTHAGTAWNVGSVAQANSLQAPVAGQYALFATAVFDGDPSGSRMVHLRLNSEPTGYAGGQMRSSMWNATDSASVGKTTVVNLYCERPLAQGDNIELWVTQNRGGTLTVRGGRYKTRYGIRFLGPTVTGKSDLVIPTWLDSYDWTNRAVMPSTMNTYVRDRQRFLYRHMGLYYRTRMSGHDQTVRSDSAGVIEMPDIDRLGDGIQGDSFRTLTITRPGRWALWTLQDWMPSAAGGRFSRVDVNGEYDFDLESRIPADSGFHTYAGWYTERTFEGDGGKDSENLTPTVWQDSGDDVGMNGMWFGARWLGPPFDSPAWEPPRTWVNHEDVTDPALFKAELDDKSDNLYRLHRAAVEVYMAAALPCGNNNATLVNWGATELDLAGSWDASQPSRLTCKVAGKYRIYGQARWKKNDNGHREAWYRINGSGSNDVQLDARQAMTTNGGSTVQNWYAEESFQVGDYIELYVRQTSGGTLNLQASDTMLGYAMIGT